MRYFALKVEFVLNISWMIVDLPQNLIYLNVLKNILKPLRDFPLIHQVRLDGFRLAIQANITLADELNLICCFMWVTCKIEERGEADLFQSYKKSKFTIFS